jgi:hypothetical protein
VTSTSGTSRVVGTADTRSAFIELVSVVTILVEVRSVVSLGAELVKRDGRERGGLVHDGGLVDDLVDGLHGVHSGGLNGLALDNGGNGLVDVVVNVLVGVGTNVGSRALDITDLLLRVVHGTLLVKLHLVLWVHLLLVFPGEDRKGLLNMLRFKDTVVLNGLHTVLVVVDVLLGVDGLGTLNVLLGTDVLLDNLGGNFGAYLCRVALVGLLQKSLDGLHCV